ncbi:MAG: LysM peptidoglycan-binding domain-containing protein, partial [Burkholderiales bacterium]|nr:LysM peptidoglycan-binding domain-containing protein [Anaerolineae bacterium]
MQFGRKSGQRSRQFLLRRALLAALWLSVLLIAGLPAFAQDNLLTNPGLEEPFTGRGRGDLNIPSGWNLWVANAPQTEVWMNLTPTGYPHRTEPEYREGSVSLNLSKGFGTFTAAIYQQVSVPEDADVRASAYAWLHTCGDPGEEPTEGCESSGGSGASVRIGIDPDGGTDPNSSSIVWSSPMSPHDTWGQVTVDASASGSAVTVFLYGGQTAPRAFNNMYWDEALLVVGGEGGTAGDGGSAPPPPAEAPAVVAQNAQEDGSVIHTVVAGDTIDSIAVAYGLTRQQIMDLNGISDPRIIQIGQQIIIVPPEEETSGTNFDEEGEVFEGDVPEDATQEPVPTSTPAPAAPVAAAAVDVVDPASDAAAVCVLLFNDSNRNRIQEQGEDLLSGGTLTLNSATVQMGEYATDGVSEPHCFGGLTAGDYMALAAAPSGYGLTTTDQLLVQVRPGASINVVFGAAE